LSVDESNTTETYDPSLEKVAERSLGVAGSAFKLRTLIALLLVYSTLYSDFEAPVRTRVTLWYPVVELAANSRFVADDFMIADTARASGLKTAPVDELAVASIAIDKFVDGAASRVTVTADKAIFDA
jgi:hypothetical protein